MNREKLLNKDYQEKIFLLVESLIAPYNTHPVNYRGVYYTDKPDGYGDEYEEHTCNEDACIEKATKKLRAEHGNFKVFDNWCDFDSDTHIDRCSECDCALDDSLNDFSEEFPYHAENTRTAADITEHPLTALELEATFSAIRNGHHGFYEPHRYIGCTQEQYEAQQKGYDDDMIGAVEYALHIINELFPISAEEIDELVDVKGLYTIYEEKVTTDITKARFINTQLKPITWKECWMYEDFHGTTLAQAKGERKRRLNEKKMKELAEEKYLSACQSFYSYRDFRKAGNCRDGILGFAQRAGLDIKKKYQGTYLMQVAEQHGRKWDIEQTIKKLAQA